MQHALMPRLPPRRSTPVARLAREISRIKNSREICRQNRTAALPSADVSAYDMGYYFVGKSILYFTLFYCGLNYFYYRDQRKKK